MFVSSRLGHRKPEPAAFAAVTQAMGVHPSRVLFLDDSGDNVVGARACGLQAAQVASAPEIEAALLAAGM